MLETVVTLTSTYDVNEPTKSNVAIFLAAASFPGAFSKGKNTAKVFLEITLFHSTLSFEFVGIAYMQVVSVFLEIKVGVTSFSFLLLLDVRHVHRRVYIFYQGLFTGRS